MIKNNKKLRLKSTQLKFTDINLRDVNWKGENDIEALLTAINDFLKGKSNYRGASGYRRLMRLKPALPPSMISEKNRDMIHMVRHKGNSKWGRIKSKDKKYISDLYSKDTMEAWWKKHVLEKYNDSQCFGLILSLESNTTINLYVEKCRNELDLISGDDCHILVLADVDSSYRGLRKRSIDEHFIEEQVKKGYSLEIADLLDIKWEEFPCMVLFDKRNLSEWAIISLKNLDINEISQRMIEVFPIVHSAIEEGESPINELKSNESMKKVIKIGKWVLDRVAGPVGKAIIDNLKPPTPSQTP